MCVVDRRERKFNVCMITTCGKHLSNDTLMLPTAVRAVTSIIACNG